MSRANMPSDEQFETARLWLELNEGEGVERNACMTVANWLAQQAQDRMLRQEARNAGVTVARLRKQLETRIRRGIAEQAADDFDDYRSQEDAK